MADKSSGAPDAPPIEIALPARLDLSFCTAQAPEFLHLRGTPLRICAEKVSFVGASGMQLLLSVVQQWQIDGQECELAGISPAFRDGAALLGYPDLTFGKGGAA